MAKKKKVYENRESKRGVSIQIRGYDSEGKYEGENPDDPTTITIKNATEQEVHDFLAQKLKEKFGEPKEEEAPRSSSGRR
jgi:hypothetical protein